MKYSKESHTIKDMLVKPDTSIKEAMKVIDSLYHGIKLCIVVDENDELKGILTDGDIRRHLTTGTSIDEPVSSILRSDCVSVNEETSEEEIWHSIRKNGVIGVPLVDKDGKVIDFVALSNDGTLQYIEKSKTLTKPVSDRILIVGGAGYIGSILTRILLENNYKVTILDNFLYGRESLEEIKDNKNLKIIEGDSRNISDVVTALEDVSAVVHLGELVGDPACSINPLKTQEINYLATAALARAAKHLQINRFIYMSSCSVYGASKGDELLDENSPLNPVSIYAKMKIASERALTEITDSNFRPTFLRLGTVFGYSNRPRFDLVINIFTERGIKDGKFTVFGGKQWRPNVHVRDVAKTIFECLKAPIEVVGGEAFNVGDTENNYTIEDIGKIVKDVVKDAEVIIDETEVDARNYKVSCDKLKKALNIKFMSVEEGVEELKKEIENGLDTTKPEYHNYKMLTTYGLK